MSTYPQKPQMACLFDGICGSHEQRSPSTFQMDSRFINDVVPSSNVRHTDDQEHTFSLRGSRTKRLVGRSEFDEVHQRVESEMAILSADERHRIFQEIQGGTVPPPPETPEVIETGLQAMREELCKILEKTAYEKAYATSPKFVENNRLRLMFLRSVEFDPTRAAHRFVKHFEQKEVLFGADRLTKYITLEDLDKNDMECMRSDALQFLPEKDRFGRCVVFLAPDRLQYKSWHNFCKVKWYLDMKAMKNDEEAQRKGYVLVLYMFQSRFRLQDVDFDLWREGTRTSEALPLRLVGLHYCSSGPRLNLAFRSAMEFMSATRRVRVRAHLGSPLECLYKLEMFGVPKSVLPVDEDGNMDLAPLENVADCLVGSESKQDGTDTPVNMEIDEKKEPSVAFSPMTDSSTENDVFGILKPTSEDVLLGGRGNHKDENPGNVRLRTLVASYTTRYNDSCKFEKTVQAQILVRTVKEGGGRFLKRVGDGWVEVDDAVARDKVAHSFRNNRRKGGRSSSTKQAKAKNSH